MECRDLFITPAWHSQLPDFASHHPAMEQQLRQTYQENVSEQGLFRSPKNLHKQQALSPLAEFTSQLALKAIFDLGLDELRAYVTGAWVINAASPSPKPADPVYRHTFTAACYLPANPEQDETHVRLFNPAFNPDWQAQLHPGEKTPYTARLIDLALQPGEIALFPSSIDYDLPAFKTYESDFMLIFHLITLPEQS